MKRTYVMVAVALLGGVLGGIIWSALTQMTSSAAPAVAIIVEKPKTRRGIESPDEALQGRWIRDKVDGRQVARLDRIQGLDEAKKDAMVHQGICDAQVDEFLTVNKTEWSWDSVLQSGRGRFESPCPHHGVKFEIVKTDASKRALRIKQPPQFGPDPRLGEPGILNTLSKNEESEAFKSDDGQMWRKGRYAEGDFYITFNSEFTRMTISAFGGTDESHYEFFNP